MARHAYDSTMASFRELVLRDGPFCIWCRAQLGRHQRSRDHLLPRTKGGTTDARNLVLSCRPCNSARGHTDPFVWGDAMLTVRARYPNDPTPAELAVRQLLGKTMPTPKQRSAEIMRRAQARKAISAAPPPSRASPPRTATPRKRNPRPQKSVVPAQRMGVQIDVQGRFLDPKRYQV